MPRLKHIESDTIYTVSADPYWEDGTWECGDQRFTDVNMDQFEVFVDTEALAVLQATMWAAIKEFRTARKAGGVHVGDHWFHSDEPSRVQYSILLTAALCKGWAAEYVIEPNWKTMSGAFTSMTTAKLRDITDTGMVNEAANFANAETHRQAMLLEEDPTTYDYSSGWVEVYEDTL